MQATQRAPVAGMQSGDAQRCAPCYPHKQPVHLRVIRVTGGWTCFAHVGPVGPGLCDITVLRGDRHLEHAIVLVAEQIIGRLDIIQLKAVCDHRAQIDPPGCDDCHQAAHPFLAAGA